MCWTRFPHSKTTSPTNPFLLMGSSDQNNNPRSHNAAHSHRARGKPTSLGICSIADGCAHELAAEDAHHVGSVDTVSSLWLDCVDTCAICDLALLVANIYEKCLK